MIEAAEALAGFVAGRARSDLDTDLMLLFAVVRAIEVVGEAASRVSERTRERAPTLPWRAIVGMRNRVIHGYFAVDKDVVWRTATEEVPALVSSLRPLLTSDLDSGSRPEP